MKKLFLTALIALAAALPAPAQTTGSDSPYRFEMGFSPVSFLRQGGQNLRGGAFSLTMRRSERLAYVLDLSFHQTSPPAAIADAKPHADSIAMSAYRFGLRYYAPARGKFIPFGEVLAGGANVGATTTTTITTTTTTTTTGITTTTTTTKTTIVEGSHNGIAFAGGAGMDYVIRPWLSWRVFHADYSLIHAGGNTTNGVRIHTGAVFHFGH